MSEQVETAVYRLQIEGEEQIDAMKKSIDGLAVSEDKLTASNRVTSDAIEKRIARYNPLLQAQQAYRKELEYIEKVQAQGVGTQQQINALFEGATSRYQAQKAALEGLGNAHKGLDGQAQAAMHSMRSMVEQLAMGVPITQVLTQQFTHLSYAASGEGGIVGAFTQAGAVLKNMITPTTAAIAAVTALGAAALYAANSFDKLQVSSQRAISGAGARTGTTVEDINKFVSQTSSGFGGAGLSDKEARDLAESFTKTGDIVISRLHDMGAAVVGFANQNGQSITQASDAMVKFAQDPIKALDDLAKTFGDFDVPTRKAVEALVQADDKTGAFQTIIDSLSGKLKDAAGNTTVLESATRRLITAMGSQTTRPSGIDTQIAATKKALDEAIGSAGDMIDTAGASKNIELLTNKLIGLQAAAEKVHIAQVSAELNKLSTDADAATRSLTPQIDQIKKLETAIGELTRAKAAGVTSQYGGAADAAALTAAQNQLQALKDSQAEAARMNDQVAALRDKWGGVSIEVAKQLEMQQNNLQVVQAVGGAEKMAAQYSADYANAMLQGKSATEATALAASNLATAQAAVNAAAKETLWNLQNQAAAAGAVTGAQKMAAEAAATYNQMVHDGVDATIAEAVAAQQLANNIASANAAVSNQIHSLEQSTAMIKAQQNGTEATTAAAQAYDNAIRSGADSTAAAALQTATLANYAARAAASAAQFAEQMRNASMAAEDAAAAATQAQLKAAGGNAFAPSNLDQWGVENTAASGGFPIINGQIDWSGQLTRNMQQYAQQHPGGPGVVDPQTLINMAAQGGSVDAAIAALQGQSGTDYSSAVQQLYGLKISGATDNASKISATQQEIGYLQGQPASLANLSQITSLQQSLDQLKQSTDTLNSTNTTTNELLSPYYSQDPRTSHIGFRSQGMASGGYVDVPGGSSANDNMLLTMPVASGERVYVDPMTGTRGGGGTVVNLSISSPVIVQAGANTDQIGRTLYQSNQSLAKQIRAAMPS